MDQPPLPPAMCDGDDPLPVTEGATAAAPATDELGVHREALAFVAGYVASKCRHLHSGLGQPTSCAPASAFVPSRWLQTISRGSLYVPSEWWMDVVEDFNTRFCDVMGATADEAPGIMKRLVACVLAKAPELDERVARKLASTRLYLRVRWLNAARAEAEAEWYRVRKTAQHARSTT